MYETLLEINQWWYEVNEPYLEWYVRYGMKILVVTALLVWTYMLYLYWPVLKDVFKKS